MQNKIEYKNWVHGHSIFYAHGRENGSSLLDCTTHALEGHMETFKGSYYKKICRNEGDGQEDMLDFANMVFGVSGECIDFGAFYPKAYSAARCGLVTHHVMEEHGKIRAWLTATPLPCACGQERRQTAEWN